MKYAFTVFALYLSITFIWATPDKNEELLNAIVSENLEAITTALYTGANPNAKYHTSYIMYLDETHRIKTKNPPLLFISLITEKSNIINTMLNHGANPLNAFICKFQNKKDDNKWHSTETRELNIVQFLMLIYDFKGTKIPQSIGKINISQLDENKHWGIIVVFNTLLNLSPNNIIRDLFSQLNPEEYHLIMSLLKRIKLSINNRNEYEAFSLNMDYLLIVKNDKSSEIKSIDKSTKLNEIEVFNAIINNNPELVEQALQGGLNPNASNDMTYTVQIYTIRTGNIDIKFTPSLLFTAIVIKKPNIVSILLNHGADPLHTIICDINKGDDPTESVFETIKLNALQFFILINSFSNTKKHRILRKFYVNKNTEANIQTIFEILNHISPYNIVHNLLPNLDNEETEIILNLIHNYKSSLSSTSSTSPQKKLKLLINYHLAAQKSPQTKVLNFSGERKKDEPKEASERVHEAKAEASPIIELPEDQTANSFREEQLTQAIKTCERILQMGYRLGSDTIHAIAPTAFALGVYFIIQHLQEIQNNANSIFTS